MFEILPDIGMIIQRRALNESVISPEESAKFNLFANSRISI